MTCVCLSAVLSVFEPRSTARAGDALVQQRRGRPPLRGLWPWRFFHVRHQARFLFEQTSLEHPPNATAHAYFLENLSLLRRIDANPPRSRGQGDVWLAELLPVARPRSTNPPFDPTVRPPSPSDLPLPRSVSAVSARRSWASPADSSAPPSRPGQSSSSRGAATSSRRRRATPRLHPTDTADIRSIAVYVTYHSSHVCQPQGPSVQIVEAALISLFTSLVSFSTPLFFGCTPCPKHLSDCPRRRALRSRFASPPCLLRTFRSLLSLAGAALSR